ncbi:strawberry notch-like NTP hydrolase domain-containing protein [Pseudooctadecabacter sp.]|uniref:strawberry notch-like NTP hydrolase domain-containing protein n=1 Tax=Pseudooctadecabacter sp. TaxID=1966338 RepID=UPI003F6A72C1
MDDLLRTPVLPDVVVMNPPFASSVDRSRDKHIAAKHLIAAAKRLAPGGRLVAFMPLSKWKPDQPVPMGEDFEGVLAFDEAHAMQNAAGSEQGRGSSPPSRALLACGCNWQHPAPASSTSRPRGRRACTTSPMRRGWGSAGRGPEYPFPSRESLVSAMEAGGVAAMEVVARDLKTFGLYTARAVSFDGVEYDVLEHALTPAQIEIYDAYVGAFRMIHHNLKPL